jgi:hypothetical protein
MTAELIKLSDLGIMLSMGERNAREFCERNGVLPINVGKGKRASLRWNRAEVMQMLSTLRAKEKPKDVVPRSRSRNTVVGKSAATLYRELSNRLQ